MCVRERELLEGEIYFLGPHTLFCMHANIHICTHTLMLLWAVAHETARNNIKRCIAYMIYV